MVWIQALLSLLSYLLMGCMINNYSSPHNEKERSVFKTDNKQRTIASIFFSLSWKHSCANRGQNNKRVPLFLPQKFLND